MVLSRSNDLGQTMLLLMLLTCLALAAAAWLLNLHHRLERFELVRKSRSAWLTLELRRRATVCRAPNDLQEYPQPRETRMLILRMAGVPLWWCEQVVGLPQHFDSVVHLVRADDFDGQFSASFQAAGPGDGGVTSLLTPLRRA